MSRTGPRRGNAVSVQVGFGMLPIWSRFRTVALDKDFEKQLKRPRTTRRTRPVRDMHKPAIHILIQNRYFPKAGKEEAVRQWRLHASDVRARLGLRRGRVLKRLQGDDAPHVLWECEYASLADREEDRSLLDQSDEFKDVQAHMRTLLVRFERSVWEIDD